MSESKLHWIGDWPKHIQALVQPIFEAEEWLIPGWVSEINVFWWEDGPGNNSNASLSIQTDFHYRKGTLNVYPACISANEKTRREYVIHEFLHLSITNNSDVTIRSLKTVLGEDNPAFKILQVELIAALEGSVCDLAEIILKRMPLNSENCLGVSPIRAAYPEWRLNQPETKDIFNGSETGQKPT